MNRFTAPTIATTPFSVAEYWAFVQTYNQLKEDRAMGASRQVKELIQREAFYRSRLPRSLIARCPFCQQEVWEAIDTYSLQGCGWRYGKCTGFGWFGALDSAPGWVKVSYESTCPHVYLVSCCLEYAYGAEKRYRLGPSLERLADGPYIMMHPLKQKDMRIVLRELLVGSAEPDPSRQSRRIYMASYFVPDAAAWAEEDALWDTGEYHYYVCYPFEYELDPWIASKRLQWLDPHDPTLALRSIDDGPFPYPQHRPRSWWQFW
jgi:hypothetical protein